MTRPFISARRNVSLHSKGPDQFISERRSHGNVRYGSPVPFSRAGAVPAPHSSCHFYSDRVVGNRGSLVSELKRGRHLADWPHSPPQGTRTLEPEIGRPA
jgi:hypothetical protein